VEVGPNVGTAKSSGGEDATVIMEGTGGAAFFIIESGQATVSSKGVTLANLGPATISARSP